MEIYFFDFMMKLFIVYIINFVQFDSGIWDLWDNIDDTSTTQTEYTGAHKLTRCKIDLDSFSVLVVLGYRKHDVNKLYIGYDFIFRIFWIFKYFLTDW